MPSKVKRGADLPQATARNQDSCQMPGTPPRTRISRSWFLSGVICVRGVCYTPARRLLGAAARSPGRSRESPSAGEEG